MQVSRGLNASRRFLKHWVGAGRLIVSRNRGVIYGVFLAGLVCFMFGCGGGSTAMNQSTANVTHITDAEFDADVLQSSQPVVVDCYATWCGPCRQLSPIVDSLADQYAGKIKFYKVNVDESPKVSRQFQIDAIPRLLFFKNGKLADSSVGLLTREDLTQHLDSLLQSKP
jgi:thioredoxin 1